MKRLAVPLFFLAFLFWSAVPAGANTIPHLAISCDQVSFSWSGFPARPVILNVTVTQGDEQTLASFNTHSAPAGDGSVPVQLHSGSASAVLSWTLRTVERHAGPVTADLTCTPTTTTASTTSTVPPTTTSSTAPASSTTASSPETTAPVQCGPATLPCTGSSSSPWVPGFAAVAVLLGAGFMALNRRGTR